MLSRSAVLAHGQFSPGPEAMLLSSVCINRYPGTLVSKSIGGFWIADIWGLAAVGGAYEFTRNASANLREKDDHYNTAIGGFVAGSLLGIRSTIPIPVDFLSLEA
jgi:hypothetical protein